MGDFLKYKKYSAIIKLSADDEVFYGSILGINDVVTFEGTSVKEVKKTFHKAVNDYLATCLALNKKPEKPSEETIYLLKSPANAKRLLETLEEYKKYSKQ